MFVDHAKIFVKAGDGGDGAIRFRREAYVPKGGPDGGDGGAGGSVVLAASNQVSTLIHIHYQQQYRVKPGDPGSGSRSSGKSSPDMIIPVPPGTLVKDAETNELVGDIRELGQQLIVAKGGRGGRGNHHFKSSTRKTPYIAEPGTKGEERWLSLELKFLADVGLVGLPNAGKSTLISVLSNSKPKIADYPFTTLIPNMGVVYWGRNHEHHFTVADIPGLIEGAHEGKGLGIQFLRHIERTSLLLHLVDVSVHPKGVDSKGNPIGEAANPVRDFKTIRSELAAYRANLMEKPFMAVATKMDSAIEKQLSKLARYCDKEKIPFFEISAVTGEGIAPLVRAMAKVVRPLRPVETAILKNNPQSLPASSLNKGEEMPPLYPKRGKGEFTQVKKCPVPT
ncbi:MAG: GTPase ObgE [Nitrospirae bacterium]|nr:GTPase ObgE [Candidatus Troglogloeales bacterium]